MKQLLLVALVFITFDSFGQISKLLNPVEYLGYKTLQTEIDYTGVRLGNATFFQPKKIIDIYDEDILNTQPKEQWPYYKKYKSSIVKAMNDYYNPNEEIYEGVLKVGNQYIPFEFLNQNGSLCIVQHGIIAKNVYNTLQLDANKRASKVVKDIAIPSLSVYKPIIDVPEFSFYSVMIFYQAKDLTEDSDWTSRGESVIIIVPKTVLKSYLGAKITDEQLIGKSIFYNKNRSSTNVKKIVVK